MTNSKDSSSDSCGVCGEAKPSSEYCKNECRFLDMDSWKPNTELSDVVADILGCYSAGRYPPTVIKQIDYIYAQERNRVLNLVAERLPKWAASAYYTKYPVLWKPDAPAGSSEHYDTGFNQALEEVRKILEDMRG